MRTTVKFGEQLTLNTPPTLDPVWPYQVSTIWQRQGSVGGNGWTDIAGTANQAVYTPSSSDSFRNIRAKYCFHGAPDGARVNSFTQSVFCTSGVIPVGGKWPLNSGNVYVAAHVTGTGEYGDGAYAPDGMNELGEKYYILIGPRSITEMENRHPYDNNEWWQLTPGKWGDSIPADVDRGVLENKSYGRPFYELYKDLIPGLDFLKPGYNTPEFGNAGPNTAERANAYGNGSTPWYLPAQYELEIMYKLFKPTYPGTLPNVEGKGFGINPILDPPVTEDYERTKNPDRTQYGSFQSQKANQFYGTKNTNVDETRDTGYWMSTHEPGDTFNNTSHGKQSHMLKQLKFYSGDQNFKYAVAPRAQDGGMLMRAIRREPFSALEEYYEDPANRP